MRAALVFLAMVVARPAFATDSGDPVGKPHGRPEVTLDRLDLSRVPLTSADEKYLRDTLAKDVRVADWGAGKGAHIEYRFRLDELDVTEEAKVLHVRCSATGFLPKRKHAKGRVVLGGSPKDRTKFVHHVLDLVAKSVVLRLADMERHRRLR